MTETALTTIATAEILSAPQLSRQHVDLLKQTVAKGTTDAELQLFLHVCRRTGLDPFAKQIYARKQHSKSGDQLVIITGIDGFRLIAERTGKYTGQIGPQWADEALMWTDAWMHSKPPAVARVAVLRADFTEPLWAIAKWSEYKPSPPNDFMWNKMPAHMLAKVAEALALRRAFPQELSGLYGEEEMHAPMIEQAKEDRLTARVAGFKGVLQSATSAEELEGKWMAAEAFRESVHDADPEAAEALNVAYRTRREQLSGATACEETAKEASGSPTKPPEGGKVGKTLEERAGALKAALKAGTSEEAVEATWNSAVQLRTLLLSAPGNLLEELALAKEARITELREAKP